MNFDANIGKNESNLTTINRTNFNPINLNSNISSNVNSNSVSCIDLNAPMIETMFFDDMSVQNNNTNLMLDNIKISNGDVVSSKSLNVKSILDDLNSMIVVNSILDKIKSVGVYTGGVKSKSVVSIMNEIQDF